MRAYVVNALDMNRIETTLFCIRITNGKRGRQKPIFLLDNGKPFITENKQEAKNKVTEFYAKLAQNQGTKTTN